MALTHVVSEMAEDLFASKKRIVGLVVCFKQKKEKEELERLKHLLLLIREPVPLNLKGESRLYTIYDDNMVWPFPCLVVRLGSPGRSLRAARQG